MKLLKLAFLAATLFIGYSFISKPTTLNKKKEVTNFNLIDASIAIVYSPFTSVKDRQSVRNCISSNYGIIFEVGGLNLASNTEVWRIKLNTNHPGYDYLFEHINTNDLSNNCQEMRCHDDDDEFINKKIILCDDLISFSIYNLD